MSINLPEGCDYAWYLILRCFGHVISRCKVLMAQKPAEREDLEPVLERTETLRLMISQAVQDHQYDLLPLDFKQRVYDSQESIAANLLTNGRENITAAKAVKIQDDFTQELTTAAKKDYPTPGFNG